MWIDEIHDNGLLFILGDVVLQLVFPGFTHLVPGASWAYRCSDEGYIIDQIGPYIRIKVVAL